MLVCSLGRDFCHEDMLEFVGWFLFVLVFLRNSRWILDENRTKTFLKWQFHILFCTGVDIKENKEQLLTDGKKDELCDLATVVTEGLQQPLSAHFFERKQEESLPTSCLTWSEKNRGYSFLHFSGGLYFKHRAFYTHLFVPPAECGNLDHKLCGTQTSPVWVSSPLHHTCLDDDRNLFQTTL